MPRAFAGTNTRWSRITRQALCHFFTSRDPMLVTVPERQYPEAHLTLRKILRAERVTDLEVEWAWGVAEGVRRMRTCSSPGG